ncbi:MAG TPA: hypothetical protein VJ951_09210, partial [Bacteroidales bacterium]|nr:hypothetical protein [Bacteroidales bacterium]
IGELIPEESGELQMIKSYMFADAMTLVAKVHGVAGDGLYDIKMENATLKLDVLRYNGVGMDF